MITVAGFIIGLMIMGIGFLMVWRAGWFRQNIGNLGVILQVSKLEWLDWAVLGAGLMVIGFTVMFGLFQFFLTLILGPLVRPSVG